MLPIATPEFCSWASSACEAAGWRRSGRSEVSQAGMVKDMHITASVFINDDKSGKESERS